MKDGAVQGKTNQGEQREQLRKRFENGRGFENGREFLGLGRREIVLVLVDLFGAASHRPSFRSNLARIAVPLGVPDLTNRAPITGQKPL